MTDTYSDKLTNFVISKETLLNKSINLYGATGSGKSRVINAILNELDQIFDQIIVFFPNESVTPTYSGMVKKAYIHQKLTSYKIKEIWDRQQTLSNLYKIATDINQMYGVFEKLNVPDKVKTKINKSMNIYKDLKMRGSQSKTDNELLQKWIIYTTTSLRYHITKYIQSCVDINWSETEKIVIEYLHFKPHILIIFDDCVTELNELKKDETITKLYTMGRHANITFFNAVQDDTQIPASFRKNAFFNVFTDKSCASGFFDRASNNMGKAIKALAQRHIYSVFDSPSNTKEEKLIYERLASRFYKIDITGKGITHKQHLGSDIILEYADKISVDEKSKIIKSKYIR